MYQLLFTQKALKALKKLPFNVSERIIAALERAQVRPQAHFSRLVGEDAYKLRVGDYRVLADIDGNSLVILVLKVDHRSRVYKR